MADRAYHVLQHRFADRRSGGYFMELYPDNTIASDIKHTYAQAFVLYSLCKYFEMKRDNRVMEVIRNFFTLLEEKTKDPGHTGYLEAFAN
jgi:mannobiose 2-epimerase